MKILLVGEFSGLHNSLKKGLLSGNHQVDLINNGDSFKDFHADFSIKANFFKSKLGNIPRQIWYRIFKYDLALIEHGIRFWWHLSKLKNYDVVQLINEWPIQTARGFEYFLLKKLFKQNKKVFLLSSGIDSYQLQYLLESKSDKNMLLPYFNNPKEVNEQYYYLFDYLKPQQKKISDLIYNRISGIIATDFDYIDALKSLDKYAGLIPYPIDCEVKYKPISIEGKINILLGVNTGNTFKKGIHYFEAALKVIREKYGDAIIITIVKDLPFHLYVKKFNEAHVLLDQLYANDQGYNALEAMKRGKVVFTGAESDFVNHYQLQEDEVCINAKPDVDYLVEKLSYVIENPEQCLEISKNAIRFVQQHHDANMIAKKYLDVWANRAVF